MSLSIYYTTSVAKRDNQFFSPFGLNLMETVGDVYEICNLVDVERVSL